MIPVLPSPRKIPVVPRPRHGELSGSYLARVARANRTDLRSFLSLLGGIPSALASKNPDLAAMVLTLNEAAFIRLLAYTGLDGNQLVRAIPSLAPRAVSPPGEPPAIRLSFVKTLAADCPGCRLRRDGAHADTRLLAHKAACLRHGYWLFGQGGGQRLDLAAIPEVAAAQRRLDRIASRHGPMAAVRAYEISSGYLQHSWRIDYHRPWYTALTDRWQQRVAKAGALPAHTTWQLPGWAVHPECTALAAVFASPHWAALAIPVPYRRHRFFYQRLLTELGLDDGPPLRTMRIFDPLPRDIQEEARWGRVLSDPGWGTPPPSGAIPKAIPFIDITEDYERSVRSLLGSTWPERPTTPT
jgi:TniQ